MSSAYGDVTQFVNDAQEFENVLASNLLALDEAELSKYTTAQKERLLEATFSEKENAFNKVFMDAAQAGDTANNIYYHYQRGQEALDANEKIFGQAKLNLETANYNTDLAKRQFEINEWAVQNKRDTLFVYQFIFITVLVLAVLTGFWKYSLIPTGVFGLLIFVLVFVLGCTIAYRAMYTDQVRNKFYWSRRDFGRMGAPPVAPICPSVTDMFNKIPNISDLPSDEEVFDAITGLPKKGKQLLGKADDWLSSYT